MKKRILASVLALVMVLSMVPTALAAEEFTPADDMPQEAAVCTCEALCTEEAVNADCPVCGGEAGYAACAYIDSEPQEEDNTTPWAELTPAEPVDIPADIPARAPVNSNGVYEVSSAEEFADAVAAIEGSGEPEATISLTAPIELTDDTLGVADTLITITSSGAETFLLTLGDSTLWLDGDVTLENIYISADTIYAKGHALILSDGFGGGDDGLTRMTVYGGSDQDLTADTNVTVEDGVYKLISGGNSAGTLTGNTYVEFGGKASFPTAADGAEKGDYVGTKSKNYNLYLKAKGEANWNGPVMDGMDYEYGILPYGIYGGGTCGNTEGNTEVVMTGGTVYQIFGGGAARRNPRHAGRLGELDDLGRVSGNTSVTVIGGEVKSVYGGGYNDIFVFSSYEYEDSGVPTDAREQRAVVEGDTYVEISGDAYVPAADQNEDTSTSGADCPAVYGGSFHSTVYNTEVVIGGDAVIESGEKDSYGYGVVYGAGCNDIVQGTTSVLLTDNAVIGNDQNKAGASVVSQGQFSAITPMGRTSQSRCYLGGAIYDHPFEIQNIDNADYAAVAEVSGGSVDVLMAGVKSRVASKQPLKTCYGNVLLKQSGGDILAIEGGSVYSKNMVIEGNVDILVTGGTTEEHILGRYATSSLGQSVINGDCTLTFSGCGNADAFRMSPLIWAMDTVLVTDDAHVAVFGDHTLFGSDKKPFTVPLYQVNDLTIDAGSALAFSQEANITGDLAVNGALHMARVKKNINIGGTEIPLGDPKAVTLTAAGTATGNGQLLPIEAPKNGTNYGTYFEPVVDEEYVYAQTAASDMELTLAEGADKFSVARKNKAAGQDVWYIAQQIPVETITVTYQWKSGDRPTSSNHIPTDVTLPGPDTVEKGTAYTAKTVSTQQGYYFDGWYLDAEYTQKFVDGTILNEDTTLYANWRIYNGDILWYRNIYIQKTDGTYSTDPSAHAQNGWAAPDEAVSISAKSCDGKRVQTLLLGTDVIYDAAYSGNRLSADHAIDASKHNPLRIYYKRPYTVTYKYDGTVPPGAPNLPSTYYAYVGETVAVADAPTMAGYTFTGWTVESPTGQAIVDGELTSVQNNVVLTGSWNQEQPPVQPVTWWKSVYYQSPSGSDNWIPYQLVEGGTAAPDTTVSISQADYDGKIIITSTGGTFGEEYVFDRTNPNNRLSATAGEATRDNPLKIYYKLAPHTVTYEYAGNVPANAPALPTAVDTWYLAEVPVAAAPTMDGYTFSGWTVKSPAGAEIKDGKLTMPHDDAVLTGSWTKVEPLYTVTYTDGVENEVIFADQVTPELHAGDPTPAFTGVPVREGYTFAGWQPAVAETVTGNAVYVAQWTQDLPEPLYTVRYDLNGGTGESGVDYRPVSVPEGTTVTVKDAPSRRGYTFTGWSDGEDRYRPGDALTVLADVTLTAQWRRNSTGGGETTDYYILHYESNGGTKYKDERYAKNTVVQLDKVPVREGYTFTGWYADEELTDPITKIKMTSDKTVYAGWARSGVPAWLNGEDHFAYIVGYADGTVRPQNTISRAEVATIFFRLLDEDVREENLTTANAFADVNEGAWFNTAVSTMAELGVIKGRTSAAFVPDAPITRAEFAAICARFDDSGIAADSPFTDLSGHWAQEEIGRAAALGWVQGYTDGTFLPDAPITRAEAVTMINRVLERLPESEADLLPDMRIWPDNQPGAWYYLAVQEATNSHRFANKGDRYERWLQLTADPDWTAYQR